MHSPMLKEQSFSDRVVGHSKFNKAKVIQAAKTMAARRLVGGEGSVLRLTTYPKAEYLDGLMTETWHTKPGCGRTTE